MSDYEGPNDDSTNKEESWEDYMDEGDISGNGPDDDNNDPD